MDAAMQGEDQEASPGEQAHLEEAHHEICTALTVLRSTVELVRIALREETDPQQQATVQGHLEELDTAVSRLHRLALTMRVWHDGKGATLRLPADPARMPPHRARLLPQER